MSRRFREKVRLRAGAYVDFGDWAEDNSPDVQDDIVADMRNICISIDANQHAPLEVSVWRRDESPISVLSVPLSTLISRLVDYRTPGSPDGDWSEVSALAEELEVLAQAARDVVARRDTSGNGRALDNLRIDPADPIGP